VDLGQTDGTAAPQKSPSVRGSRGLKEPAQRAAGQGDAVQDGDPPAGRRTGAWAGLRRLRGTQSIALPAVVSLFVIAAVFQSQSPYFLSPRNLTNLAIQITIIASIALAEIPILLLGEIDLSLGSISGATAAVLAVLLTSAGLPWWVAVLGMFACGTTMGLLQGLWIAGVGVPSFVVTLAGLLTFLGVQLQILGSQGTISISEPHITDLTATALPPTAGWIACGALAVAVLVVGLRRGDAASGRAKVRSLAQGALLVALAALVVGVLNPTGGVPTAFLVVIGFVILGWWITRRTRPGRHLFAVGGNAEAARRAGIRVRLVRLTAFGVAGMLAALGGLLAVSYNGSAGTLTGGGELLLDAIGAAVIGGTSLFGGEGSVWSALLGALVIGGVANGLDLTNHSAPVKYIVQGLIVLFAVGLDSVLRRRRAMGMGSGG